MDLLTTECAAQSLGPANQLFGLLVQTILAAQCAISPKDLWPKDYGPTAVEQGEIRREISKIWRKCRHILAICVQMDIIVIEILHICQNSLHSNSLVDDACVIKSSYVCHSLC